MSMLVSILESTLRVSAPILFAAMAGCLSERSGVINIGLEGLMLAGSFGGAAVALATGSPWLGALGAAGSGLVFSVIFAGATIKLRADQVVAGFAINMLAAGVTPFLCKVLYGSSTASPSIPMEARFSVAPLWAAWALVPLVHLALKSTSWGMWLRFAGEKPEALDAAGVSVRRVRWSALMLAGVLAGLGGGSLSLFLSSGFARNMTAGRGFMALAALIFGKWRPLPAAAACLLFGLADALQIRLQGVVLWGSEPVPVQFIQILPYIVTVGVLAGVVGRSRAPGALGRAWTG